MTIQNGRDRSSDTLSRTPEFSQSCHLAQNSSEKRDFARFPDGNLAISLQPSPWPRRRNELLNLEHGFSSGTTNPSPRQRASQLIEMWPAMHAVNSTPATGPLKQRAGLTLVELLVSVGVIGILLSLLLPAVQNSREAARRSICANNLKQIGLALHNYHDAHSIFPPGALFSNELGWHVFILPQLDQGALYSQFNFNQGQYWSTQPNGRNNPHGLTRLDFYLCPSGAVEKSQTSSDSVDSKKTWTTHYYGIMGPRGEKTGGGDYRVRPGFGPFGDQGLLSADSNKRAADITDGASNTFVVGEISWNEANCYRTWVRGVNGDPIASCKNVTDPIGLKFFNNGVGFNDISLGSEHPGGTHVLMGDGAARFVSEVIDLPVYKASASIDGGEVVVF